MRRIDKIIIHCSATKHGQDIGVNEIRKWHKARGFSDVGYHYVIRGNGVTEDGRLNQTIGAHAKGHNKHSIGVCLVGGLDEDGNPSPDFTREQRRALRRLVDFLQQTYSVPNEGIMGHRDLPGVAKACPCFEVERWLEDGKMRA